MNLKRLSILLLLTVPLLKGFGQDTISGPLFHKPARLNTVRIGHAALYTGSLLVLNQAWYKDYPKSPIHSFDDSREWLQVDKIGHGWSAYNLARLSTATWRWAGVERTKASWAGTLSGFTFMTVIEFLDSRSAEWGWSWADMAANTLGSGLYLGQELLWREQRIQYKFSFHRMRYTDPVLRQRADNLYGKSLGERMLKDYNGQTYWLSFNLHSFLPDSKIPAWLNLAIGYGGDGMFGGFENRAFDKSGNVIFDRRDITRNREWYISPDIDLSKIKTNKKWVRTGLYLLNAIKIPAPALRFGKGGALQVKGFYF